MKLVTVGLMLLLFNFHCSLAREVTNTDIRDGMVSLVNMVRTTDNKLERHEAREKALGEQIKRSLTSLEKGHRSLDPLKGAVSRLDERLSNVETILIQKEEQEKEQAKKLNETINMLKSTLEKYSENISKMIRDEIKSIPKPVLDTSSTNTKLEQLEKNLNKKIDGVTSFTEEVLKKFTENIKNSLPKQEKECNKPNLDQELVNKHFDRIEKLLQKLETKVNEHDTNISKLKKDILPLHKAAIADEAHHNNMTAVLEKQNEQLKSIEKSIAGTEALIKSIPTKVDAIDSKNQTLKVINSVLSDVIKKSEDAITGIKPILLDIKNKIEAAPVVEEKLPLNETDVCKSTEETYLNVIKSYDLLKSEIQALPKVDKVLIQTADNVLDTKRRIEYGIHQILLEVGETIKLQSKALNTTFQERFNDIELSIADSQANAFSNLTKKIDQEMSQVWRQIGIMYQQLTTSTSVLDRLQQQTEQYVNGSISTMDGMEGKISLITKRTNEIESNLNYLLGRLSLVTQEFTEIQKGLSDALDNIKKSFQTVQEKVKDVGPGPHNITKRTTSESRSDRDT